jgi:protein-disulfide isomerase
MRKLPDALQLPVNRRRTLAMLAAGTATLGINGVTALAWAEGDAGNVLAEGAVLRDPDLPATGNADGDLTIVEYFDFNCPYCRKIAPELAQVVQDDGKVRLVYKDWPILGPVSIIASRMALATKYQNKYVAAHEALMGTASRLTEPRIRELLAGAGVDVDRAKRDLATNAKTIDAILARNDAQARAFGFHGTPAFIIGKFRVPGAITMTDFEHAIADARKAAASNNRTN